MTTVLDFPTDTDRIISATVKGLYSGRSLTADDVARAIKVSHGTMNNRLRCKVPWTADEVQRLALFFGVERDDLYDGMDGIFPGPDGGASSRCTLAPNNLRVFPQVSADLAHAA